MTRPHRDRLEAAEAAEPISYDLLKTLAVVEAIDALAERLEPAIVAAPDPAPPALNMPAFFGVVAADERPDFEGDEKAEESWTDPSAGDAL